MAVAQWVLAGLGAGARRLGDSSTSMPLGSRGKSSFEKIEAESACERIWVVEEHVVDLSASPAAMRRLRNADTSPSDADLLANVASGDLRALGVLFDRYEATVKRFIGRLNVARAEIDDLVQLTFLDVPGAAARFDARCSFKSWLLGLAAMVVRRHRRSAFRMATRLAAWATDPSSRAISVPEETLERREAAARAMRALEKLSHRKREVFVMMVSSGHGMDADAPRPP